MVMILLKGEGLKYLEGAVACCNYFHKESSYCTGKMQYLIGPRNTNTPPSTIETRQGPCPNIHGIKIPETRCILKAVQEQGQIYTIRKGPADMIGDTVRCPNALSHL